jgi:hypothetical protein
MPPINRPGHPNVANANTPAQPAAARGNTPARPVVAPAAPAAPAPADGFRPGAPAAAPAAPGAPAAAAEGKDFGVLNPTAKVFSIPASIKGLIRPTNEALDLGVLNADFNPLKGRNLIPDYKKPDEVFEGKAVIPTRDIMGGVLKQMGPQAAALAPLLAALPQGSVLRTPAQEFNIGGVSGLSSAAGNRIIFYGGSHMKPSDVQGSVSDVDTMAMKLGEDQGLRVMKEMVHFIGPAQGGTMQDILGDGVGGATHGGGFSSGYVNGKDTSIYSDWPANYGRLADYNKDYNAHLFAINYQGGVEKPLPQENVFAYKHNADMWDAILGAVVPFASNDPDPRYTTYTYNPLDAYDQASLSSIAHDATALDWDAFKKRHGAFYCAEGQYIVANLGPQEGTLLKRSEFGFDKNADGSQKVGADGKPVMTKLGALIDGFQDAYNQAPAHAGDPDMRTWTADQRRQHPDVGWNYLAAKGQISDDMLQRLKDTGRIGTYLEWIPETMDGWQKFNPLDKEQQMVAEPMTVATLAWSLIHRYMPREGIAQTVKQDILNAYKTGNEQVQGAIKALLGGNDPNSAAGQAALGQIAFKASTATLAGALGSDDMKKNLLQKAGFEEITNDADKATLMKEYDTFIQILMNAPDQKTLDEQLEKQDDVLRTLKVHRATVDDNGHQTGDVVETTMLYAAPPSIASWAQNEDYGGGPQVLQYIATAMHADQEKKPH